MVTQLTRLGPWPAGLNLRDAQVASDQLPTTMLRELVNLDVTDSGVLVPRRGTRLTGSAAMYTSLSTTGLFSLLGSVEAGLTRYAVVAAHNGSSPGSSTFYYSSSPASTAGADWPTTATTASKTGKFSAVVQYGGRIYFVPATGGGGAGWYRTSLSAADFTTAPNIPLGDEAFMVRDRLFVVDRTAARVYYSKPTDPLLWAAADGGGSFDVNPGDGQDITGTAVLNSQIYVFKRNRTYLFSFTADPALDGQLTLLNDQLGAFSAVTHENGVLLANEEGAFRLLNNYFSRIDDLVVAAETLGLPEAAGPTVATVLEAGQLVIGPATLLGGAYTHLAMNLRTGSWSGRAYPDPLVAPSTRQIAGRDAANGTAVLYGHLTRTLAAVRTSPIYDRPGHTLDLTSAGAIISPLYSLTTGEYDFGSYFTNKRMSTAAVRCIRGLIAGDASLELRQWLGPELAAVKQSVAVPAGTGGGAKVPVTREAFRSLALGVRKVATTLSPTVTDPSTASTLWVRGIEVEIDSRGGSTTT